LGAWPRSRPTRWRPCSKRRCLSCTSSSRATTRRRSATSSPRPTAWLLAALLRELLRDRADERAEVRGGVALRRARVANDEHRADGVRLRARERRLVGVFLRDGDRFVPAVVAAAH